MRRGDRKTLAAILAVQPHILKWQEEIEKEQESVIGDLSAPAKKVVEKLIQLDNRRVDLCNLNVLYAYIERGLGAKFSVLEECIRTGADSALFDVALKETKRAGYDIKRIADEFGYLFDKLPKKRGRARSGAALSVVPIDSGADRALNVSAV